MAKAKLYAVKIGVTPGIYKTWDECKSQINNFKGAIYKSFTNQKDADAFMSAIISPTTANERPSTTSVLSEDVIGINVYVDGSYNPTASIYGWGYAVYKDGVLVSSNNGSGDKAAAVAMRNVAGELSATMHAVKELFSRDIKDNFVIHHDYKGIAEWVNGSWKTKNECTKTYVGFIKNYIDKGMNIKFNHVKGHTGVEGNEFVDRLAKEACGII